MTTMYNFATLDPRKANEAAEAANEAIFTSAPVYGVEVTVPQLAARCAFNLDPQHSGGDAGQAAIEAALTADLPAEGTVLATVRADLDSVGAMAIIAMRAEGATISDEAMERVAAIAEVDKSATAPWAPQPLPTADRLWSHEDGAQMAALAAMAGDFKVSLSDRVTQMAAFLTEGTIPATYMERVVSERRDMVAALNDGRIQASVDGGVAVVVSSHRAATAIGYSLAPVVVATNPVFRLGGGDPHLKHTVCQYSGGYADLKSALAELAALEEGWGGSPTIGGSPQGVSSTLATEEVVEVVRRHLK